MPWATTRTMTPPISHRRRALLRGLALAPAAVLLGCGRETIKGSPVPAGAVVLALGDSLTFGTGAALASAYPAVLAQLTGWQVVNAGVPGDTSAQALDRTPALLQAHQPALVLLCIGGNDLLRRQDEAASKAAIEGLVNLIRQAAAQVMLIAVPKPSLAARFTGSLDDHPMYGQIAQTLKVPLHRQGWSTVLADDSLRADPLHANAAGYEAFAKGLMASLRASALFAG